MSINDNAVSRLASQSDAIGRLAQDSGGFAAVVAAFESKDAAAFRWVLDRLEMFPYCELICDWVRIKLCVLRCIEVCGPPASKDELPDLQQFAHAIVTLSSNAKVLRRAVDAISCGDADDFQAALAEAKLSPFCHLLCRWICSVIYERVCHVVCRQEPPVILDVAAELKAAGDVVAAAIKNERLAAAISQAATTLNCEILRQALDQAGFRTGCEIICRLICIWRCVWICRSLCTVAPPVLTGTLAIEEAQNFAKASRALSANPRALGDLVAAVESRNAEAYRQIIERYGLGPYCWQICAWVCAASCYEFCVCVCPPALQPWFTTVGYFDIYSDINAGTGKTNKSLPFATLGHGGGPNFAFTGPLQLGGFCPSLSPVFSGVQMKYRFQYDAGSGPLPITGSLLSPMLAGTRITSWPGVDGTGHATAAFIPTFQSVIIQAAPLPPDPVPPAPGAPWVGPAPHYITADANGWVLVDLNAIGGGFQTLLGFNSPAVVPGGPPLPGVTAGSPVPAGNQRAGRDLAIIFQATRVTTLPPGTIPDYTNSLSRIHINNWGEVNLLNFAEFATGCCTPIDATLTVQFTVDHEEMDSGAWSLKITSCSTTAPGDITPTVSGGTVTLSPRGGSGTIVENTKHWDPCSYTATLTTRPGLTTGLVDRGPEDNPLTFCICGHKSK
jgi:hypothetical protein